jgi:hypothetical protein
VVLSKEPRAVSSQRAALGLSQWWGHSWEEEEDEEEPGCGGIPPVAHDSKINMICCCYLRRTFSRQGSKTLQLTGAGDAEGTSRVVGGLAMRLRLCIGTKPDGYSRTTTEHTQKQCPAQPISKGGERSRCEVLPKSIDARCYYGTGARKESARQGRARVHPEHCSFTEGEGSSVGGVEMGKDGQD